MLHPYLTMLHLRSLAAAEHLLISIVACLCSCMYVACFSSLRGWLESRAEHARALSSCTPKDRESFSPRASGRLLLQKPWSTERLELAALHLHQNRVVEAAAVIAVAGLELDVAVEMRDEVVVAAAADLGLAVDEHAELLRDCGRSGA